MRQILFYIPRQIGGVPIFSSAQQPWGLLLIVWAVGAVALVVWHLRRQGWSGEMLGDIAVLLVIGGLIRYVLPHICKPAGLPIPGYGVMLLIAVLSAVGMAVYRGRRLGLEPDLVVMLCFWIVLPGILGARVFYVIEYWQTFQRATLGATLVELINFTEGGIVVYGALIGGVVGMVAFIARHKLPPLATFDLMAPSLLLGLAIGRIGCLLNGCCFGGTCDLPWAVTFPAGSPAYVSQVERGEVFLQGLKLEGQPSDPPRIARVEPGSQAQRQGLAPGDRIVSVDSLPVGTVEEARWALMGTLATGSEVTLQTAGGKTAHWSVSAVPRSRPVHPTQVYSSINAALLCLLLLAYAPFRRRDGEVWALLLTLYPLTRILLEFIRNDEPGKLGTPWTISQLLSLALLSCVAGFWIYLLQRPRGTAFPKYEVPATG